MYPITARTTTLGQVRHPCRNRERDRELEETDPETSSLSAKATAWGTKRRNAFLETGKLRRRARDLTIPMFGDAISQRPAACPAKAGGVAR